MVSTDGDSIDPAGRGALFYLYAGNLAGLREQILAAGIDVGEIVDGTPGPRQEMWLSNPFLGPLRPRLRCRESALACSCTRSAASHFRLRPRLYSAFKEPNDATAGLSPASATSLHISALMNWTISPTRAALSRCSLASAVATAWT